LHSVIKGRLDFMAAVTAPYKLKMERHEVQWAETCSTDYESLSDEEPARIPTPAGYQSPATNRAMGMEIGKKLDKAQSANELLTVIANHVQQFNAIHLTKMLHGLAKHQACPSQIIISALRRSIIQNASNFNSRIVVDMLWGFACLKIHCASVVILDHQILQMLTDIIKAKGMVHMNAQSISTSLLALSILEVKDVFLRNLVIDSARSNIKSFKTQDISVAIWGLVMLGAIESKPEAGKVGSARCELFDGQKEHRAGYQRKVIEVFEQVLREHGDSNASQNVHAYMNLFDAIALSAAASDIATRSVRAPRSWVDDVNQAVVDKMAKTQLETAADMLRSLAGSEAVLSHVYSAPQHQQRLKPHEFATALWSLSVFNVSDADFVKILNPPKNPSSRRSKAKADSMPKTKVSNMSQAVAMDNAFNAFTSELGYPSTADMHIPFGIKLFRPPPGLEHLGCPPGLTLPVRY